MSDRHGRTSDDQSLGPGTPWSVMSRRAASHAALDGQFRRLAIHVGQCNHVPSDILRATKRNDLKDCLGHPGSVVAALAVRRIGELGGAAAAQGGELRRAEDLCAAGVNLVRLAPGEGRQAHVVQPQLGALLIESGLHGAGGWMMADMG